MAAPVAAPAGAVYVGGAAVAYGLMYAVNPAFRAAHDSLGAAMAPGASDAYSQIENLILGEDSTPGAGTVTQTQTETDTATG